MDDDYHQFLGVDFNDAVVIKICKNKAYHTCFEDAKTPFKIDDAGIGKSLPNKQVKVKAEFCQE